MEEISNDSDIFEDTSLLNEDYELLNIENNINDTLDGLKEEKTRKPKGRIPKKQKLINDIIELERCENTNIKVRTRDKELKRKKIPELEAILGNTAHNSILKISGVEFGSKNIETGETDLIKDTSFIADMMYKTNVMAMGLAEDLSINYQDYLGTHMKGASLELTKNEEQLKACFYKLYQDNKYKQIIDKFMTPTSVILAINFMVVQKSLVMNLTEPNPDILKQQEQYKEELKKKMQLERQQMDSYQQ